MRMLQAAIHSPRAQTAQRLFRLHRHAQHHLQQHQQQQQQHHPTRLVTAAVLATTTLQQPLQISWRSLTTATTAASRPYHCDHVRFITIPTMATTTPMLHDEMTLTRTYKKNMYNNANNNHNNNNNNNGSPAVAVSVVQRRAFSSNNNNNGDNGRNSGSGSGSSGGMQLPPWLQQHLQSTATTAPAGQFLQQYTTDWTALAEQGKLDPVLGRHDEIRRCLQILARRTKNNPCLIGQAGVGKTAIVEGLAQRIHAGQVPESMKQKRVLALNMTALMAGTAVRGQLEDRMQGLLRDLQAAAGQIILFVDELHTVVGAGSTGGGDHMDVANMLKPALARGELQLVGATTLQEYRTSIEKDAALARRFQAVYVAEPNLVDTLAILRGLKTAYELHHGIRIKDEALVAAVQLSQRYLTDRFQPDKSIDLIDEACSRLRLEQESKPEILWKLERDLMTKQIEWSALQNEDDDDDKKVAERKKQVQIDLDQLQKQVQWVTTKWEQEKHALNQVQQAKKDLEQAKQELEHARRHGNFNRAGELMHGVIPKLEHQLEVRVMEATQHDNDDDDDDVDAATTTKANSDSNDLVSTTNKTKKKGKKKQRQRQGKMLAEAVTADAIATIVARHTGIPVSRIRMSHNNSSSSSSDHDDDASQQERYRLLHMEDILRRRVVGQDHALSAVANCVRLVRTQLQAQNRTLGNFLFLGPTGVGKTETAKALAEFLFDDANAMTCIDMSEYSEKHTVSRLIGAPPGYIGYEDAGMLTESIRRRPYQVLLLDEFEKAHRNVWNLFLQLFDEGHLTDSQGRKVDFRNVIVIMTSNLGAQVLTELPEEYKGSEPQVQHAIMDVVRHNLTPELLNRIDETIIFHRLQRDSMHVIANIGIQEIAQRLESAQNMKLDVSMNAKSVLAEMGYDVRYGARPLKRVLNRELLNPLSRLVLEGSILDGDTVRVRTRAEAERDERLKSSESTMVTESSLGWMCSNPLSNNKNDVVVLRNHVPRPLDDGSDNDDDDDGDDKDGNDGYGGLSRINDMSLFHDPTKLQSA